jgi:hypothetical protein
LLATADVEAPFFVELVEHIIRFPFDLPHVLTQLKKVAAADDDDFVGFFDASWWLGLSQHAKRHAQHQQGYRDEASSVFHAIAPLSVCREALGSSTASTGNRPLLE